MASKKQLQLKVKTEWGDYDLDLDPGRKVTLGRSPAADIVLPNETVSQEHLILEWNGLQVIVRDVSSNGTFRLPQNAPFKEASFAVRPDTLSLRLSKTAVTLSWQPVLTMEELTEVVANPASETPRASSKKNKHEEKTEGPVVKKPTMVDRLAEVLSEEQILPKIDESMALRAGAWLVVALAGLLLWIVSSFVWTSVFLGILRAPKNLLSLGGAFDLQILWLGTLFKDCLFYLLGIAAALVFASRFVKISVEKKSASILRLGRRLGPSASFLLMPLKFLSALLLAAAIFAPGIRAMRYGAGISSWYSALKLYRLANVPLGGLKPAELTLRSRELKKISDTLKGSSLLYVQLFQTQRQRVLNECGGVGDQPWQNKKFVSYCCQPSELKVLSI